MDKKNTLLLTVIAIATLLVAVVGATFAYFSAQTGAGANADINVKTSTTDTLMFNTKPIFLLANQQNFANVYDDDSESDDEHAGSQKVVSTSTVNYKKGGAGSTDYCYTVTVNITNNNFEYAPVGTNFESDEDGRNRESTFKSKKAPELILKLTKKTEKKSGGSGDFSLEGKEIVYGSEGNQPLKKLNSQVQCKSGEEEEVNADCVYFEHLTTQRKVCTQNNDTDTTDSDIKYTEPCNDTENIEGFDVTVLNNQTAQEINKDINEIGIPTADGGSDFKHKLTAEAEGDEVRDTWTAELVFVNYNWDQQYNASKNDGTQKKFSASLKFTPVSCEQ